MKSVRDWVKSRKREETSRVRELHSLLKISREKIRHKRAERLKISEKRTLKIKASKIIISKIKTLKTDSVKKNLI